MWRRSRDAELTSPIDRATHGLTPQAAIESLLCARVSDTMIGDRHNSNTELIAQVGVTCDPPHDGPWCLWALCCTWDEGLVQGRDTWAASERVPTQLHGAWNRACTHVPFTACRAWQTSPAPLWGGCPPLAPWPAQPPTSAQVRIPPSTLGGSHAQDPRCLDASGVHLVLGVPRGPFRSVHVCDHRVCRWQVASGGHGARSHHPGCHDGGWEEAALHANQPACGEPVVSLLWDKIYMAEDARSTERLYCMCTAHVLQVASPYAQYVPLPTLSAVLVMVALNMGGSAGWSVS